MQSNKQQRFETIIIALVESFLFSVILGVVISLFFVPTIGGAVFLTLVAVGLSRLWWEMVATNLLQS